MVKVGLTYDTGADKMNRALEILRSLPAQVENVSSNASDITAFFSDYGESSLNVTFYYYITKQGNILQVMSDMNLAILAAFNKEGLDFAFPTRTVIVQEDQANQNQPDGQTSRPQTDGENPTPQPQN